MFGLGLEQIGYNSREFVLSLNFKSSFRQNENIPETNLDEHYICMYMYVDFTWSIQNGGGS